MSTQLQCSENVARSQAAAWVESRGLAAEDTTFLRGLLGGIRCGVLAVDPAGELLLINQHACHILGYEEPPAPGTPINTAFEDHPQLLRMLEQSLEMVHLPNRAELDLGPQRREGTRIGFTVSHIPDQSGTPVGAAVFFKDLTRIEQREEKERLRDRLAALGEMAARLAHEVRNPLASIEVSCGLLRRRCAEDESARQLIDKITAEVRRLNETVTSSLEFVKPVASELATNAIEPLLHNAIEVARTRHGRDGVSIELQRCPEIPEFRFDATQLRQVFENLLLNAAEAVGEQGRVWIDVERTRAPQGCEAGYDEPLRDHGSSPWDDADEYLVVRVSDDGPGIPTDAQSRIFHPFFTTKRQGSGVGLSTVKKIVDSHGGLIDVDRSTSGGARFTVRLPMISAKAVKTEGQQR